MLLLELLPGLRGQGAQGRGRRQTRGQARGVLLGGSLRPRRHPGTTPAPGHPAALTSPGQGRGQGRGHVRGRGRPPQHTPHLPHYGARLEEFSPSAVRTPRCSAITV
ncbi:hypothetical protein ACOMHN_024533 [Nucella lapillus]